MSQTDNTLDKLEWLTRVAHNSHYGCEYRQDNTPRTSVKCAGCSHSRESYEQSIRNVLNYVADREKSFAQQIMEKNRDIKKLKSETKKAEVRGRIAEGDYWLGNMDAWLRRKAELKEGR